jgi:glycosyltransferase involved in cell wall biosynthesis
MPPPRVMFVNHTSKFSGAELVLLDVVRPWRGASVFLFEDGPLSGAMKERGLQVIISRWARGVTQLRRNCSLWNVAPLLGRMGAIALEIAGVARRHDILYANSQKAFTLAAFASAFAKRPLIWHLHDIIDRVHFGAAQRRIQVALANRSAARVVVPSEAAAAAFIAAGGRDELIEVIPNGVDLTRDERTQSALRAEFGLPAGALVGVFSRLAPWKGQHILLRALALTPKVHCIVAGDALFGEQAYAARLRALTAELGIAERVHFLGHRSDVPLLMQAVDVVVHPSVDPEPFGRTLVEAMLAGVPIIAADTGAASSILAGGAAGTLVAPNDPAALAVAITRVLTQSDELAGQLGYAAARARGKYAVGRMLESISSLIDRTGRART